MPFTKPALLHAKGAKKTGEQVGTPTSGHRHRDHGWGKETYSTDVPAGGASVQDTTPLKIPPVESRKPRPQFAGLTRLNDFWPRLDLGAFIFAPYILVIVWQYLSIIRSRPLAWMFSIIVTGVLWTLYVAKKEAPREKLSGWFWPIVAIPLLLIYLARVAFPDISFDVLNYHIFHGERALRGAFFISNDFFPTVIPFNPTPDILTGLFRKLLGYRLGTIANYLALIWTGAILERILRVHMRTAWLRAIGILFVLGTEQILFQINEYMVDLLALPLLLEATVLALDAGIEAKQTKRTAMLSLYFGVAAAFKLTNLLFALPIGLVFVFNLFARADRARIRDAALAFLKSLPLAIALFIAPLAPFTILIYRWTGNPVFPLFNGIFRSPYWPRDVGVDLDPRWGPSGVYETLIWPVLMFLKPNRLSEFPYYSGRLTLGYILAAVCLLIARRDRNMRALAFITLLGLVLWSGGSGYIRYGLYLELTSGVLLIWFAWYLWERLAWLPTWGKLLAHAPLYLVLLGQGYFALRYINHSEWGGRQTVWQNRQSFRHEAAELLRDRSLKRYLEVGDSGLLDDVDVWVETTYKTAAFNALLKPNIPVIGVRMNNYFATNEARQRFSEVLKSTRGKRLFTLTNEEGLEGARADLTARGLSLAEARPVPIYFFSKSLKFDMLLVEVVPRWQNNSGQAGQKGLPLPDMAFQARLAVANLPTVMRAGQQYTIRVSLKNESEIAWPGKQPTWQFQITVGDRWLAESRTVLNNLDGRAPLLQDLKPSESVVLPLTITAPNEPGTYILELDVIQESVAWFGDRGSEVFSVKVKVE